MRYCVAAAAAIGAALLAPLLTSMPAPFDNVVALDIPLERQALYPGRPKGSSIPADMSGPFAANEKLHMAKRLFEREISGSESVAVTPSGDLIMLDRLGYVHRAVPAEMYGSGYDLKKPPLYIGPGRPLGFHVLGDDTLLVCDSLKGLLRVTLSSGAIEVLSNAVHGPDGAATPFQYANDLDVAADGTVYFTSCTNHTVALNPAGGFYDTMRSATLSAVRGTASGQLLRYDPRTRRTTSLARGISYANGVALSSDESWVAIVETYHARVLRHWLKGAKKGKTEVLLDRLPGFPDGISRGRDGGFWLCLVYPLAPLVGLLAPYRLLRQLLSHVVVPLLPLIAKQWGAVVRLDADGRAVETLYDPTGWNVATISAATEAPDGRLFLGNLAGNYVSVVRI